MTHKTLSSAEIEDRLWKSIEHGQHTGMLNIEGDGHHFQPMTAFVERETNRIWFFTRKDSDIAQAATAGSEASFVFQSRDLWACIDGTIREQLDRERMDKYWNVHVAAWYPEGKDDPHLTILQFDADDGRIWVNEGGFFKFFYEVAKANVTKTLPKAGGVADVNLQ